MDTTNSEVKIIEAANEKFREGDYEAVLRLLDETATSIEALRLKNQALRHLHKYEESIAVLLDILTKLPNDFQALFELGNRYFSIGDFEKSIEYHEQASALYPNHPTIIETLSASRKKIESGK